MHIDAQRKISTILRILAEAGRPVGSTRITDELQLLGIDLKARMVRYYLTELRKQEFIEVKRRGLGKTNVYIIKDILNTDRQYIAGQDRQYNTDQKRQSIADKENTVYKDTDNNVVVNTLKKFKVGEEKAGELAARHSAEYIEEKIEFLQWRLETKTRGRPVSDPAAWLIRAIEKDYQPPDSFKPKAQRQEEAKEIAQQEVELEKQHQESKAREEEEKDRYLEELRGTYGTTQEDVDLWAQVLQEIELATTSATYQTWFPQTTLLSLENGQAVIGVPNKHTQEWLTGRHTTTIQRAFEGVTDKEIDLEFVVAGSENTS